MSIYAGIKEELIEMIQEWDFDQLSVDDLKFEKKKMMKFVEIAIYTKKRMDSLNVYKEPIHNDESVKAEKVAEEVEENTKIESPAAYPLRRLLSGGTLNNGSIYIPEKAIRKLNAHHGDLIRAELYKDTPDRKYYNFDLMEEKHEPDAADRNQLSYGIVRYDDMESGFYIEEDIYHNPIYVEGSPVRMSIQQRDIENFELKEGDIVDIAWHDRKSHEPKVIWKYADTDTAIPEKKHPLKKSTYKKTMEHESIEIEQNLSGKSICLVGCEPYHADLKKVVEERGGDIKCLSGDEPRTTIETSIRKSDACIVSLQHISHDASKCANAAAKEADVPFESFNGYGRGQFLTAVYKSLDLLSFAG